MDDLHEERKQVINDKFTELCTRRGALTHQIEKLSKQLSAVDTQIDGLDIAMSVVTQLEVQIDDEAQKEPTSPASE